MSFHWAFSSYTSLLLTTAPYNPNKLRYPLLSNHAVITVREKRTRKRRKKAQLKKKKDLFFQKKRVLKRIYCEHYFLLY